jgi:hypothetical protein
VEDNFQTPGYIFMAQALLVVFGVLNFRKQKMNEKSQQLNDAVVQLHDIARLVEQTIGSGLLSEDIRAAADRLNVLINPVKLGSAK